MKTTRKKESLCKGRTALALAAACLALAAASCKKDDKAEPVQPVAAFTASTETHTGDSKTHLDGMNVVWDNNDQIKVFGSNDSGTGHVFTVGADGGGATSAKFTSVGGTATDVFYNSETFNAFYPANNFTKVGENYQVTLPRFQEYVPGGFASGYNPMIAFSKSTSLQFKNLCGVLKLQLKGDYKVGAITVTASDGEYLSGKFNVGWGEALDEEDPGHGDEVPTLAKTDGSSQSVTLLCGGLQLDPVTATSFYIVVPAGSLKQEFDVDVFEADGIRKGHAHASSGGGHVVVRSRIRPMEAVTIPVSGDDNTLVGEFSVSGNKKVRFSKGNLQATWTAAATGGKEDPQGPTAPSGGTYSWGFASEQWEYVGNRDENNGNTHITEGGANEDGAVVDLFGWSTSSTYYGINISAENATYGGDFYEWGHVFDTQTPEGNVVSSQWYTLSNEEYFYLVRSRSGLKCAEAKVGGVNGLLVFPDAFSGSNNLKIGGLNIVSGMVGYSYKIVENVWSSLQGAGVVFLPCVGTRVNTGISNVGNGYYWSSMLDSSELMYVYAFSFYSGGVYPASNSYERHLGHSVRLVRRVSAN